MRVNRFHDRDEFARRVTSFLMLREAENCFFLGMISSGDMTTQTLRLAVEDDRGEVIGVAIQSPGRHVVMSESSDPAVEALADHFLDNDIPLPGAQGNGHVAER